MLAFGVALVVVLIGVVAARRLQAPYVIKTGQLYSIEAADWGIRVVKVLVAEQGAVHIRLYKEQFPARPTSVDTRALTLGRHDDPDGFGVGHLPLSESTFRAWRPLLVGQEAVEHAELDGYEMWKEAKGGLF